MPDQSLMVPSLAFRNPKNAVVVVAFGDDPKTPAPSFDSVARFDVIGRDSYSLKRRGASCFQRPELQLAIVAFDL